jgi:hypothetical protein
MTGNRNAPKIRVLSKKTALFGASEITALGAIGLLSIPNIRPKFNLRLKLINFGAI